MLAGANTFTSLGPMFKQVYGKSENKGTPGSKVFKDAMTFDPSKKKNIKRFSKLSAYLKEK